MSLQHVTDHADVAASQLTEQFRNKTRIVSLCKSWVAQAQALEDQAYTLQVQRAIATATGANLDVLGALVGQPREGRTDQHYRLWIEGRVLVNKSRGKTPQLIAIAAKLCEGPVELREYQPATFIMYSNSPIPGTDGVEIAKMLKLAKAAGVAMQFVWFDVNYAFRFSPTGSEVLSSAHGFGKGRLAAVSDGRDMDFPDPPPPGPGVGYYGGALLVVL